MSIHSAFTEPPRKTWPAYSYGMLAFILALLAFDLGWRLSLPPFYHGDRNMGLVVPLMLLFNHLAYQFRWPPPTTVTLRLLSWGWMAFGWFYILLCVARAHWS
jgi:hypothetical protein